MWTERPPGGNLAPEMAGRGQLAPGRGPRERAEAWFCAGHPEMILVLSLNGGRTMYATTEVSLGGLPDGLIRVPEGGRSEVR